MANIYLVPVETIEGARGPKYFYWKKNPTGIRLWSAMDYGFLPTMLLVAKSITPAEHDALILNSDVYAFPADLNTPVDDQNIDVFFEAIHIPTDWLTPSTTWLELLRNLAGMFQLNQRYGGIAAEDVNEPGHSLLDNVGLDDTYNDLTTQEQGWLNATVESFGYDSSLIKNNTKFRSLLKTAANLWEGTPFYLGGIEF